MNADRRARFLALAGAAWDLGAELVDELVERLDARPATPATSARMLTKAELAIALGCSTATIDRDARIPFVRVGESKRFDLEAVRAALAEPRPATSSTSTSSGGMRLLRRAAR